MKHFRLLLADDHVLIRSGIRALLEEIPGVEVVAEASDGREALELMRTSRPDLALIDVSMPGLNGIEVVARAAQEFPQVATLILSMYDNEEYVRRALQAGAKGYLRKDSDPDELRLALETVARKELYLNAVTTRAIISAYARGQDGSSGPVALLSPRLREILKLLAEGNSTKEIARQLSISPRTVETHRAHLMEQLDIHDVAGLTRYAMRVGLIFPDV